MKPYKIIKSIVKTANDTAADVKINYQTFFISNSGAQALYISAEGTATTNSFYIAAGTTIPIPFTCETLSILSNATTTTVSIMIVE
jgi:hypothetical protein